MSPEKVYGFESVCVWVGEWDFVSNAVMIEFVQ